MTIHGAIPSKSNCYKIVTIGGHSSLGKTPALRAYEVSFYMQCKHRGAMIDRPFKIDVDVYHTSDRPDLDNAFKALLDCLQYAKVIKNDRKCVEIHARKLIDKKDPRVEITLHILGDDGEYYTLQ